MATIKTLALGVSPYPAAAAEPTALATTANGRPSTVAADTSVIVNGQAALNNLITTNQSGVFQGANVTINLEEQNFNTTNQVTSNTNYPSGNTGEIQFNSGSNSFASNAYFTYDNSNVITPGIRTDGYFYSNGAPFIGGGNAAIGNFVFTGDTMSISDDANASLTIQGNSLGNNLNQIIINPTSVDLYAFNNSPYSYAELYLDNSNTEEPVAQIIVDGNSTPTQIWTFDSTGNITLPGNTFAVNYANGNPVAISGGNAGLPLANGTSNINIATANGNVTVTANGSPTWTFGINGNLTFPSSMLISNESPNSRIYQNSGTLKIKVGNTGTFKAGWDQLQSTAGNVAHIIINGPGTGQPANVVVLTGDESSTTHSWFFDSTGNLKLPGNTFAVKYANNQPVVLGSVLPLANGTSNINIATANGNVTVAAGTGNTWTFATGGNLVFPSGMQIAKKGLDTRISQDAGNLKLTAGNTASLKVGWSESEGTGTGPLAQLNANGSDAGYPGNVVITTGNQSSTTYSWFFDNTGNLKLPANTFAVNYANGDPVVIGVGGGLPLANGTSNINIATANGNVTVTANATTWVFDNTGNLTTPGSSGNISGADVITANVFAMTQGGNITVGAIPAYTSLTGNTIVLTPAGGTSADQQLVIYPTTNPGADANHLHLTSGNLYNTELFLGDDFLYVKLANTGNVVVNTNDLIGNSAQWTFGTDGNLTFPTGNLVIIPDDAASGNAAVISSADHNLITGSFGANGGTSSLWVEDIANVGTSNIAAVYANPVPGSGNVRIAAGTNGGPGPYLWDFQPNGNLTAPGNISTTGNITGVNNISTGTVTLTNGAVIKDTALYAVAFGQDAGLTSQGQEAVAIGHYAGRTSQGPGGVAIGVVAGNVNQGIEAVAIGAGAGRTDQGIQSIAIGSNAGQTSQGNNSIIINAAQGALDQTVANTFTVAPVRNDVANTAEVVFYNTTSKEITYGNVISVAGNITGNYFIGDGSQLTGINNSFAGEMHVSKNGNDSTGTGNILQPYLTVTHALTQVAGGRNTIVIHPGEYTENPTITSTNTQLITYDATGASTIVVGTVTMANVNSRIAGLRMANLIIAGNSQVYISGSTVTEQFTKSSSGYVEVDDCELQVSGNVLISGSGTTTIIGNKINNLVVNNAGAAVLVKGANDCLMPQVTAGSLNIVDSVIRASSNTANAVTASAGTVVTLMNNQIVTPAADNVARVSIAGFHSIISLVYDKANSTLSNSLNSVVYFQTANVDSLVSSGNVTGGNILTAGLISATGNITGNCFIGNGSQLTSVAVPSQTILPTVQTITVSDTSGVGNAGGGGSAFANVTVSNVTPVTEYGVIITSGTSSQKYATGALGSIPGTVKLSFTTGLNSTQFTVFAYVTSNAGTYYSNAATGTSGICLLAGTQIALSDGTHKAIEDITYTDTLLSWDFDRGCYAETTALWIKRSETGSQYNLLTFSDGTTLRTFDQHRIFNKQAGAFTYPMTDATPVGTITVNEHGQEITLTNKQVIRDTIDYYNVITDHHMNLFSDSVLTSCRFNNIYPVIDMKFTKDSRTQRTRAEFANIPDRFFHGLRLTEQTADVDAVEWYVDRLMATEVAAQSELIF